MAISGEIVKVEYYDPATDTFRDFPPQIVVDNYCGFRVKVKNTGENAFGSVFAGIARLLEGVPVEVAVLLSSPLASGEEVYTSPILTLARAVGSWVGAVVFFLNTTEVDKWEDVIAYAERRPVPPVPITEMMMMLLVIVLVSLILRGFFQSG